MTRVSRRILSHRSLVSRGRWLAASTLACLLGVGAAFQVSVASARDVTLGQPTALGSKAPRNVPSDYVVTPNGYFHPSCVGSLAAGESLDAGGNVLQANGQVRKIAPCAYPHYAPNGTRLQGDLLPRVSPLTNGTNPEIDGWVVAGQYLLPRSTPARFLAANMTVPPGPSTQSGQVLYFFPGLEDYENVVTILQPVLAWNGFNDNNWTIASWNCCKNGRTWHSAPVSVAVGDTIKGTVTGARCSNAVCPLWSIVSSDVTSGNTTKLVTSGYGQVLDWVFGGVLEVYGVSQCSEFPNAANEDFTNISAYGTSKITQPWQQWLITNSPACGYSAAGFPNADSPNVRLTY
ncbi:MAG: hypothetical protein JSS21_09465 [Proteobacteria bacterium]|nr:hypothetical protein [Pseudomonadota bacterium]